MIARRWWRPAPTKRTVFTPGDATEGAVQLPIGLPRSYPGRRNETRFQRAIAQPSLWVKRVQIRWPWNVPVTIAVIGPPAIWVQTRPRGVGVKAAMPSACSFRQAVAGLGTVPRAGLQASVNTLGACVGVARYTIRRSVAPVPAAAAADTTAAARMAATAARTERCKVHSRYPQR